MKILLIAASLCIGGLLQATQQSVTTTSIARFGNSAKYSGDFKSFPYVKQNAPKGGKLKLSTVGTFDVVNPYIVKGSFPEGIQICYEGMMRRSPDEPFSVYALLAEKVELVKDRSSIVFHINPKAKFHDGTQVKATDVVKSYETLRDKGLPRYKHWFTKIKSIEIINDLTVKVTFLPAEHGGYDHELPMIVSMIPVFSAKQLKEIDFANSGLKPVIGTGPYYVEKVEQGRFVIMKRNPNYWGKDLPINKGHFNFDEIRVDMYKNAQAQIQAFFAGEFDMMFETNPNQWQLAYDAVPAVKDGRIMKVASEHKKQVAARTFVMNIGTKDPLKQKIFSNLNVRRALVLAFDFNTINRIIFDNMMRPTNSMFANTYLAHRDKAEGKELGFLSKFKQQMGDKFFNFIVAHPFTAAKTKGDGDQRKNLEIADKLLKKEGWIIKGGKRVNAQGEDFTIELMIKDPRLEKVALAYRESLKKLGIFLSVRMMDTVQYENRVTERNFDMIVHTWANSLSPGTEQTYYFGQKAAEQPGSSNYMGLKDPVAEGLAQLVADAKTAEDHTAAARALDRYVMHQCYQVPLNYDPYVRWAYWKNNVDYPPIDPNVGLNIINFGWAWALKK